MESRLGAGSNQPGIRRWPRSPLAQRSLDGPRQWWQVCCDDPPGPVEVHFEMGVGEPVSPPGDGAPRNFGEPKSASRRT
jgi:hypothetical protein